MNNTSKAERLRQEADELEKKEKARQDFLNSLPEDQRLAEIIHEKMCRWNHTDGCGYYYETWDKPGYSKTEYLKKAKAILQETDITNALKVVRNL